MDFTYNFPAVRGIQAGREYYITMIPLKYLVKLLPEPIEYVPPEFRAQRRLNELRIPEIKNYILENRDSYIFSSLTASIDGKFSFQKSEELENTGLLKISMDAKMLINDGQHRRAAIAQALAEDETLEDETISVVLFEDHDLEKSQQMFTDLNKHAVKTSNSIAELYDSRDPVAVLTRKNIMSNAFLNEYTDKEKDNLGKYSSNLFTLNLFYKANRRIFGKKDITDVEEKFLDLFWNVVVDNMTPWVELRNKEISKKELRENYISIQGVVIQALGRVGGYIFSNQLNVEEVLVGLRDIDWKRSSKDWKNRTIRPNGRIIANETAILLTANQIKKKLGIPLTVDERVKEKTLQ